MANMSIKNTGQTLLELMTTVCNTGIPMAIATPSFMKMIADNRTGAIANQLFTALAYTRSEAIKRVQQVTIKRKGVKRAVGRRVGISLLTAMVMER
jgi:Tfp pilus assembly protein FimT